MGQYRIDFKTVEGESGTREQITVDADIIELAGGILALSRKVKPGKDIPPMEPDELMGMDPTETPPTGPVTYTEIVFLMPLHRILHVQKLRELSTIN